jgi:hypothetical protein
LTPRDANIGRLARCPIDEGVGHRGLANAGLSGDEHDLPFTVQHPSEPLVKLAEQAIASYEDLGASRRRSGPRRRALRDGGDEPVPSSGQRLDERGLSRVVPENGSNLGDVALQNLRLNVRLWPEGFEDLVVGHESPGVLDEIPQHGKGLGCEKNALLGRAITTPEALVDGIEPERRKLSHRPTTWCEKRSCGDENPFERSMKHPYTGVCTSHAGAVWSTRLINSSPKENRNPPMLTIRPPAGMATEIVPPLHKYLATQARAPAPACAPTGTFR